jgi:hypothetical protein
MWQPHDGAQAEVAESDWREWWVPSDALASQPETDEEQEGLTEPISYPLPMGFP